MGGEWSSGLHRQRRVAGMFVLGLAAALVIGVSLGLLGGGGSVLTLPVFVYILGYGVSESVASSLFVVGVASAFGALGHWRSGRMDVRVAAVFGSFSVAGAFASSSFADSIPPRVQLLLFGVVMISASVSMLRRGSDCELPDADHDWSPKTPQGRRTLQRLALWGLGVGVLTGVIGVGGGFLIVPALVMLCGVPVKQAVGTSLLIISLNSASGLVGYLGHVSLPWQTLLPFALISTFGIAAGIRVSPLVSPDRLKRYFAVFLIVVATAIITANILPAFV